MKVWIWFECVNPECLLFAKIVGSEVDPKFAEPEIGHHHLISMDELRLGKNSVHCCKVRSNFLLVKLRHFGFIGPLNFGESAEEFVVNLCLSVNLLGSQSILWILSKYLGEIS